MTDDLTKRVGDLERRFAAAEARAEERQRREIRMEGKLDMLVDEMNRTKGREAAEKREHVENREDRDYWARWVQHFVPAGVWVAVFTAVAAGWNWLRNGGQ